MFKRFRYQSRTQTPQWLRVAFWLFVSYLVYVGWRGQQEAVTPQEDGTQQESLLPSFEQYPAIKDFTNVNRWRGFVNPSRGREIEFQDIESGSGDGATCGQQARFTVTDSEGFEDQPEQLPEQPFTLTLDGNDDAFRRAVLGMREGGLRQVIIGARFFGGEPTDAPYHYTIRMEKLTPSAGDRVGFSGQTLEKGTGNPAFCGEPVRVYLRVWSADNKELYRSEENVPLDVLLGQGEYGHGIDRGLVGIRIGEVRRLMIPPAYQPKGGDIAFPRSELAIVEVIRVPYKNNETQPETNTNPEEQHEPDRKPSERD